MLSSLKQSNNTIELLIDSKKCDDLSINEEELDGKIYLNNLDILIQYFQENNIIINTWKIKTNNNLFVNNFYFKILDRLYQYFTFTHQSGQIFFPSNYSFCDNELQKIQVEKYLHLFQQINVKIVLPYYNYFHLTNISDNIINFMLKIHEKACLIITNKNLKNSIDNYKLWVQKFHLNDTNCKTLALTLDKTTIWTDDDIKLLLKLLEYIINDCYSKYDYNLEKFTQHVLSLTNQKRNMDLITLQFYDKDKNNCLNCGISNLTIDCADLNFYTCCGLHNSIFNGGKFLIEDNKIIDIIANEGINVYINQKVTNVFFTPDCFACEDKYFCERGCRAAQFEYSTESYFPISEICKLFNSRLNFLIKKYNDMGVFNTLFIKKPDILSEMEKYELIKLLKNKGYPEYEYRYL